MTPGHEEDLRRRVKSLICNLELWHGFCLDDNESRCELITGLEKFYREERRRAISETLEAEEVRGVEKALNELWLLEPDDGIERQREVYGNGRKALDRFTDFKEKNS